MKSIFLAFFILGLINNFSYVVMLSAAESIVEGAAGSVLLADILPTLIIKLSAPFWVFYLSYWHRIIICGICGVLSFYLTGLLNPLEWRLFGVCLASLSSGLGEITFLSLTSFYNIKTVGFWSSGTGAAGICGAGFYLLLIMFMKPRFTLLIGGIFPILYVLIYYLLLKKNTEQVISHVRLKDDDFNTNDSIEFDTFNHQNHIVNNSHNQYSKMKTATFQERLIAMKQFLPYMLPLYLVYAAEYTINTGINPVLSFSDMNRTTFYVASSFVYQIGVFISRSSTVLFTIDNLWPLPILQWLTLIFFLCQALFNFIHSGYIMLCFTFFEGILGGATYVNGFRLLTLETDVEWREFGLTVTSVADTCGIVSAGIISMFLECTLAQYNNFETENCVSI